jgi:hypothetical protein
MGRVTMCEVRDLIFLCAGGGMLCLSSQVFLIGQFTF